MPDKINKHTAGLRGQQAAEAYLCGKGYKILERNYRLRIGEIDIIACDGKYIAFIEVKFRTGTSLGLPREAVNAAKQRKIIQTAMHYISAKAIQNQDFRFDVTEVLESGGKLYINHIEDAFSL